MAEPYCEVMIKVRPRSSQNKLETGEGCLNAWVTAPPTDGQANAAVCELVAKAAGISKSSVSVVSGHSSRQKKLHIEGITQQTLFQRLG